MTICIMAMCENNSKLIIVSDRMLTVRELSIEFEHPGSKIETLANNCCAVTAGNALPSVQLFSDVKEAVKNQSSLSVRDLAEEVKKSYIKYRARAIEELYIYPRQLESIDHFYQRIVSFPMEISLHIDNKIQNFDFDIDVMVGGVDVYGGHIYTIENPGRLDCYDSIGYCAIGSGTPHAELTFISYVYNTAMSINDALYVIYEAKRLSEKAPGVGKETDIYIIDQNGTNRLDIDTIRNLDDIYVFKRELENNQFSQLKEKIDQLDVKKE